MRGRWFSAWSLVRAIVVAVAVNVAGLVLLVELNDRARRAAPPPRDPVTAQRLDLAVPPPPEPPPPDTLFEPTPMPTLQPRLAAPALANVVRPPRLDLPAVSAVGSIEPGFDFGGGSNRAAQAARDTAIVFSEDQVDDPPRVLHRTAATYPREAREDEIEGWVRLRLLIGRDGLVRKIVVLGGSPRSVFDAAATRAVRGYRFEPARYRGKTVRVWVRQKLEFRLE